MAISVATDARRSLLLNLVCKKGFPMNGSDGPVRRIRTPEEAAPFEVRGSIQRWPRAGEHEVYTIKCQNCGKRHRLAWHGTGERNERGLEIYAFGTGCGPMQVVFDRDALPDLVVKVRTREKR